MFYNNNRRCFLSLQTFTKNKPVDFKSIPICLESENPTDFRLLDKVAKVISDKAFAINSEQRKALHVAAVFVNNLPIIYTPLEIKFVRRIKFHSIFKPLILETAHKIMTIRLMKRKQDRQSETI
jgi:hypothetical protein